MKDDTINNTTPAEEPAIVKKPKKEHRHSPLFVVLTIVFGLGLAALAVINVLIQTNESRNCKVSSSVNKYTGGDEDDKDDEDEPNNNNNNNEPSDDTEHGKITLTVETNVKRVVVNKCQEGDGCFGDDDFYEWSVDADEDLWYRDGVITIKLGETFDGVVFKENVDKKFKISGTIKQLVVGHFGNGGSGAILMLKDDGTVAAIQRKEDTYDFVAKDTVKGLNNITALYGGSMGGDGGDVYAVDTDGKARSVWSYLWELEDNTNYWIVKP